MKTHTLTNALLAVIALALIFLAGQSTFRDINPVHAAQTQPMQWDYSTVRIKLRWESGVAKGIEKSTINEQDFTALNRTDLMTKMGQGGWELVTDTPYSLWASQGSTTDEMLVFKRPHTQTSR